jgi:hypothetical protein
MKAILKSSCIRHSRLSTKTLVAMSVVVELNVGGTKFVTTKETLLSAGGNWFTNALANESVPLVIDRDPSRFAVILNYLRTKRVSLNGHQLIDIKEEAAYFQMSDLASASLEFCSVLSCSCSNEPQHNVFHVQGTIQGSKSFREEVKGNFSDCQAHINKLLAAGWSIDSVSQDDKIYKPFLWYLHRVVVQLKK